MDDVLTAIEDEYERLAQVGEGTFGKVYQARDRKTGELVALKKIRMEMEKEGFPVTAAREIKLLKSIHHENIVKLYKICASSASSVHLVFEYLEYDLAGLLQHQNQLYNSSSSSSDGRPIAEIKCIIHQLLKALVYLHERGTVHRDLKGSNVLISKQGIVKLADFGLAKVWIPPIDDVRKSTSANTTSTRIMTNRVITLWYRPPEVLLGSTKYGPEVDMWGVGCILGDLLNGKPIFPGQDEINQLEIICRNLGPLPSDCRAFQHLPWLAPMFGIISRNPHERPPQQSASGSAFNAAKSTDSASPATPISSAFFLEEIDRDWLARRFGLRLGVDGLDFLRKLLTLDPDQRINAKAALDHQWLSNHPLPCNPSELSLPDPSSGDWHEFACKQRQSEPQHKRLKQ